MPWVGVAYPQLFSRRGGGIWLDSTGMEFIRASLSLATASRSEACGSGRARLRPLELAGHVVTALGRSWQTGGETLQRGRFGSLGASASKLGMGRSCWGLANPSYSRLCSLWVEDVCGTRTLPWRECHSRARVVRTHTSSAARYDLTHSTDT